MVTQSVAEIIRKQVVLEVEGIDRLYLNGYIPMLQTEGGFVHFVRNRLGLPIASTAAVAGMTAAFVKSIEQFAATEGIEVVTFRKGQRKDDVAKEFLARCSFREGVLFIGKAQEKARVFRTVRKKKAQTASRTPGSPAVRRCRMTTLSTFWTRTSDHCSSSSVRTFRTP